MRITFTQVKIEQLQPPSNGKPSATFWDSNLAGFGIRVSKFRKTWIAAYTVAGGKQVMESLATTDLVPKLDDARERQGLDRARAQRHQPGRGAAAGGGQGQGRGGGASDEFSRWPMPTSSATRSRRRSRAP